MYTSHTHRHNATCMTTHKQYYMCSGVIPPHTSPLWHWTISGGHSSEMTHLLGPLARLVASQKWRECTLSQIWRHEEGFVSNHFQNSVFSRGRSIQRSDSQDCRHDKLWEDKTTTLLTELGGQNSEMKTASHCSCEKGSLGIGRIISLLSSRPKWTPYVLRDLKTPV